MPQLYRIISTGDIIVADEAFMEQHYPGDYELYNRDELS